VAGQWLELEHIAAQLWGYFTATNRYDEGLQLFGALPEILPPDADADTRKEADLLRLFMETWYQMLMGDMEHVRRSSAELLALSGQYTPRTPQWHLYLKVFCAYAYYYLGDAPRAVEWFQASLNESEISAGRYLSPYITHFLAFAYLGLQQWSQALLNFERTLVLTVHYGISWLTPYARRGIGVALLRRGDPTQAYPHLAAAANALRVQNDQYGVAYTLINMAEVQNERAAYLEACEYLQEALQVIADNRKYGIVLEGLIEFALLYYVAGQHELAIELAEFVVRHPALMIESSLRVQRIHALVCDGVPQEARDRAHVHALSLDMRGVVQHALAQVPALRAALH
jgi:tetratricopeptide (TPR) repeat protein